MRLIRSRFVAFGLLLLGMHVTGIAQTVITTDGPTTDYPGVAVGDASIVMREDGSVLSAGTDLISGEFVLYQIVGDEITPLDSGSNPDLLFPSIVIDQSIIGSGVAPSVGALGFNADGNLKFSFTALGGLTPEEEEVFDRVLGEVEEYFDTVGCEVVDLKVDYVRIGGNYYREILNFGQGSNEPELPFELPPEFATATVQSVTVHCTNGITYRFYVWHGQFPTGGAIADGGLYFAAGATPVEILNIAGVSQSSIQKGTDVPNLAIPPSQSVLSLGFQVVDGYIGLSPDFQQALPTVIWRSADSVSVEEVLQLSDYPTSGNSNLQLCGGPSYEHLWMSWTSATGTVQVAFISNRTATINDLGPGSVINSLACDDWGNAVVAYSTLNGNTMFVTTFGRDGSNRGTASFAATQGTAGMPIIVDVNNNGEVAVAWAAPTNQTFMRRLTIADVVKVDVSFNGSWNNQAFDGEGFIWDVAEIDGVLTLVLYYFTYQPDGSGRQGWVVGSGPIVNGVADITMAITEGATFGNAYDPNDVLANIWGEIEVRVTGCRGALMTMRSPLFGNLRYSIGKFTAPPADLPGICVNPDTTAAQSADSKGAVVVDGSFSGSFFSPARNFEGFIFDVTEIGGQTTIVVYWFSYDIDGSGRQLWLVGAAPISGNSVTIPLVRTEGPEYGLNYDPSTVSASSFVTVTITWSDCINATVMYQVDGGESGSFNIQRLAALPGGAGGVCGS